MGSGTFEMEITNERLHSTLTASAFRLVAALGAQIAASVADTAAADAPPAGTAAARRPGGPQGGGSSGGASGSGGPVPAGSGAAPVRVMEGVKEDAYRWERSRTQWFPVLKLSCNSKCLVLIVARQVNSVMVDTGKDVSSECCSLLFICCQSRWIVDCIILHIALCSAAVKMLGCHLILDVN